MSSLKQTENQKRASLTLLQISTKIEIFMYYLRFMVMNDNDRKLLISFNFIHDS
jgi:hypothetical protein